MQESESDLEDEGDASTEESPELLAEAAKAANCVKVPFAAPLVLHEMK